MEKTQPRHGRLDWDRCLFIISLEGFCRPWTRRRVQQAVPTLHSTRLARSRSKSLHQSYASAQSRLRRRFLDDFSPSGTALHRLHPLLPIPFNPLRATDVLRALRPFPPTPACACACVRPVRAQSRAQSYRSHSSTLLGLAVVPPNRPGLAILISFFPTSNIRATRDSRLPGRHPVTQDEEGSSLPPPFAPSPKPALPLIPDPPSPDSPCCLFPARPVVPRRRLSLGSGSEMWKRLGLLRLPSRPRFPHHPALSLLSSSASSPFRVRPYVLTTMRFFQALGLTRNSTRKSDTIPVKAPVAIQPPKKVGCLPLPIASTPRSRMSCSRPLAIFLPLPHHVPETQTDDVQPLMRSQPCR